MRTVMAIFLLALGDALAADRSTPCDVVRWEPFIAEAAARFEIPALWIRAVLRAESAGCERLEDQLTTSPAGAMGLMQLMPPTWNEYRQRLKLGDNAYDPRDNILAGAAYLRDLYERYGWPAAAAAYHTGPRRYEDSRLHGQPLPATTLEYLARIDRLIGQSGPKPTQDLPAETRQSNPLFVELRHRNPREAPKPEESEDVQHR